ncbi:MAG: TlpA disulfide reductase family protein [Rhodocyclaceae bacterium]
MDRKQALATLLLLPALPLQAHEPPGLPPAGQAAYREYQAAPSHRAFAIAPGGAWGWAAAAGSPDSAQDEAIGACRAATRQKCTPYANDERLVFDEKSWPRLWGPYAGAADARKAGSGRELGQRLDDMAYRDAQGVASSLGKLRGKVVVAHFWGSWCAPCRKEMPELARLHKALAERRDMAFVVLQVREPFAVASRWANAQRLTLPLADSGSTGEDDTQLHLANGRQIADREIARSFPTTYVLDKHGLVIFSHRGPVHDWRQYEAFLRDAAERSGK